LETAGLKNLSGPAVLFVWQFSVRTFRLLNSAGMNFLARQKKLREYLATTRQNAKHHDVLRDVPEPLAARTKMVEVIKRDNSAGSLLK
jgi:hypothetical protein